MVLFLDLIRHSPAQQEEYVMDQSMMADVLNENLLPLVMKHHLVVMLDVLIAVNEGVVVEEEVEEEIRWKTMA